MGYQILLFDLDDTLLDFSANEASSLVKLFQHHGHEFSPETRRLYREINGRLWGEYENGNMTLDEVLNSRFAHTMLTLGQTVDGAAWELRYRELLEESQQLFEGALEVCRDLSVAHRLFVVSNGVTALQVRRLQQAGLYDFFEDVFVSDSVGRQKPSPDFFACVAARIRDFRAPETLIIGDSLSTDIKGGRQFGIDTCWVNRSGLSCPAELASTYTIANLAELYAICKVRRP